MVKLVLPTALSNKALQCVILLWTSVYTTQGALRKVEEVSSSPRLYLVQGFATDLEMDHIIKAAWTKGMSPQMENTETGIRVELPVKNDPVSRGVFNRMGDLFPDAPFPDAEDDTYATFRVRRYLPDGVGVKGGDTHPPHTDWYPRDTGGTLVLSLMLYLTSPENGGTTRFAHAQGGKGFEFTPTRGDLAVWWSCHANGTQDFLSEHSSEPLLAGIKWNAVRFIYADPKLCSAPASRQIEVPDEADNNTPQPTAAIPYGYEYPAGVVASPMGTRLASGQDAQHRVQDGADEELSTEELVRLKELLGDDENPNLDEHTPEELQELDQLLQKLQGGSSGDDKDEI